MPFLHAATIAYEPPLRLDTRKGGYFLTSGATDFLVAQAANRLYWPSPIPGLGFFRRGGRDGGTDLLLAPFRPESPAWDNIFDGEYRRYCGLLEGWRQMPDVPTHSEFAQVRSPQPYHALRPVPQLDFEELRRYAMEHALRGVRRESFWRAWPSAVKRAVAGRRVQRFWGVLQADLEEDAGVVRAEFERREPADRAGWEEAEARRVARLERLLLRDAGEVFATACDVVRELRVPFPTRWVLGLEDPSHLQVVFEVPDAEKVIQPTRRELLRSGEIRKMKREKEEQHRDFAVLVTGYAIHAAAFLCSHLPFLAEVTMAAVQPPASAEAGARRVRRRPAALLEESYLLEIPFEREDFADLDLRTFDPVRFVPEFGGELHPISGVALGRIDPPRWAVDLRDVAAGAAAPAGPG